MSILKNAHENIIHLLKCYTNKVPSYTILVMPYCPTDFYDYFISVSVDISTLHIFLLQITRGLAFIHQNNIIHGDIKPENIVVSDHHPQYPGKILFQIIDFGISCFTSTYDRNITYKIQRSLGTPRYQAPEISDYEKNKFFWTNHSFDIYALGSIVTVHFSSLFLSQHINKDDIIKEELIKRTCQMACHKKTCDRIQAEEWHQKLLQKI